jgi:hypothetical protein
MCRTIITTVMSPAEAGKQNCSNILDYVTEQHCDIHPDGTRITSPNMDYSDFKLGHLQLNNRPCPAW